MFNLLHFVLSALVITILRQESRIINSLINNYIHGFSFISNFSLLGSPNGHSPVLNLSKSNPDRVLATSERVPTPLDDQDASGSEHDNTEDHIGPASPHSNAEDDVDDDNISEVDDDDEKDQGKQK